MAALVPSLAVGGEESAAIATGLREAYKLNEKNDHQALAAKLRELLKQVEQAGAKKLAGHLPEQLGEWKGAELKPEDLTLAGGGISLSRTYANGEKKITVKAVKDSPVAGKFLPLLQNEQLIAASGRKTERVDGKLGVYENERKLQMAISDTVYLEVAGNEKCGTNDIASLARKLDLRALAQLGKAAVDAE